MISWIIYLNNTCTTGLKLTRGWGVEPLDQWSTPLEKCQKWGWRSVLHKYSQLCKHPLIFSILHFPGNISKFAPPGKIWTSLEKVNIHPDPQNIRTILYRLYRGIFGKLTRITKMSDELHRDLVCFICTCECVQVSIEKTALWLSMTPQHWHVKSSLPLFGISTPLHIR